MASAAAICIAAPQALAQTGTTNSTQQVQLAEQPLGDALIALSMQLGVTILVDESLVNGQTAPAVSGRQTLESALEAILAETGLEAEQSEPGTFVVAQRISEINSAMGDAGNRPGDSEPLEVETVVVTGSRIQRTAVNAPSPIDIVTTEDVDRFGLNEVTEALRFASPALLSSQAFSSGNDGIDDTEFGAIGISTLDLRGLGAERTLVLVNGRRHVAGAPGSAAVDVGTIPQALIERVEVLTGGGSSIYGADAVSGVVNYILRNDFEGIEYRLNYGQPTRGQGESYAGSLAMGGNFADDRGNAVISVEYNRQTQLRTRDRDFLQTAGQVWPSTPELAAALGIDPRFQNVFIPDLRGSGIAQPPGLQLAFGDPFALLDADDRTISGVPGLQFFNRETGELRPFNVGPQTQFSSLSFGGDGAPFGVGNLDGAAIPNVERVIINGFADYDVLPELNVYMEAKYASNKSTGNPPIPVRPTIVPIARDNAFLPAEVAGQLDSLETAIGFAPPVIANFQVSDPLVNQPFENDRDTYRIVGGVRGDISPALQYDVSANYGQTNTTSTTNDEILLDRFFAGIDAVESNGEVVCRSTLDPSAPLNFLPFTFPRPATPGVATFDAAGGACVPINLFAPFTQEQVDFFRTSITQRFKIEQFVINATVTGNSSSFFELPAGGINYAAGFEYRDESSRFEPDSLETAGLGERGFQGDLPETVSGSFDVFEGFVEVNIPILADLPFAKRLDLDASVRVADYSTIGGATSFAVGGVWQPTEDVRIRTAFNRAVRAPNIAELFTPQRVSNGGVEVLVDPCNPANLDDGSDTRADNCALLVPANFPNFPVGFQPATALTSGGNPNLNEETADTFTVGFAFTPQFLPGLSIVADYYNIQIDDAITQFPEIDLVLRSCADAPTINNAACDAIQRRPDGSVESILLTALNLSSSTARGIDYQVRYAFNLDEWFGGSTGNFTAEIGGNYLIEREEQVYSAIPESVDIQTREIGDAGGRYFPRHAINASLVWNKNDFSANYGFTYLSSVLLSTFILPGADNPEALADPFFSNVTETGDAFVHNLGGSYRLNDSAELSVQVNNLFDREPFDRRVDSSSVRPVGPLGRVIQFGIRGRF
ncbi:secretin/TonB-like protein [Eilatimonas milleporae]|uniref:Secretin/TonB-like protein n=2 Tax=Eilatimonas milleporae TaxID=911205 RepID=A0A3M0C515_9PROT|nr:secretin/TonB-like protein [Eilatimonas milleporae]